MIPPANCKPVTPGTVAARIDPAVTGVVHVGIAAGLAPCRKHPKTGAGPSLPQVRSRRSRLPRTPSLPLHYLAGVASFVLLIAAPPVAGADFTAEFDECVLFLIIWSSLATFFFFADFLDAFFVDFFVLSCFIVLS